MTLTEFYETEFTINGEKPPPLTGFQRNLLTLYESLGPKDRLVITRGRRTEMKVVSESTKEYYKILPMTNGDYLDWWADLKTLDAEALIAAHFPDKTLGTISQFDIYKLYKEAGINKGKDL